MNNCIIIDVDNTLAVADKLSLKNIFRSIEDGQIQLSDTISSIMPKLSVSKPIAEIMKRFAADTSILIVTGREEVYRAMTQAWLKENGISWTYLYMRGRDDKRKDAEVKRDIYNKFVKEKHNVLFVIEDRREVVEYWRSEGLLVLQCADGDY